MRAVSYNEFSGPIHVVDVEAPRPAPDEAVIEVKATGICRSDWHGWQGHDPDINALPHVPGHEFAGVVAEVGADITGWEPGDRVTVPFVAGCGTCEYCLAGDPQVCPDQSQPGFTHWGSFAEKVVVRHAQHNLVPLPDSFDFVSAAALGCRFATSYRAVVQQGRAQEGEWIAVYGCGGVGLSAVMIGAALGTRVIAVDVAPSALEMATRLGAETTIQAEGDPSEEIVEVSRGGAHLGIDALGHPDLVRSSVSSLRRRGRHVQVGLLIGESSQTALPMDRVIARELEIIGSHGTSAATLSEILDFVIDKNLDLAQLVGDRLTLERGAHRLEHFTEVSKAGVAVITDF